MEHHHSHEHCHHEHKHEHSGGGLHVHPIVKNMRIALALNLSFTVVEFIGGILTNSVAILSDAIHDLGDSVAIAASLVLEKQSQKGRTNSFTYGKRRFSTLAAFITSLILVVGSVVIIFQAVPRFFAIQPVHAEGMLWLSLLGISFNGLALLRLRKGSKTSLNQRAVMLHLMEDALGWIAVLAGSVVMYFTDWFWIDPLLSLGIAGFILYNATNNIAATLKIFLQSVPSSFNGAEIKKELEVLPQVQNAHDLHCWTMDGEYNVLTVHLVVKKSFPKEEWSTLKQQALAIVAEYQIQHATIQFETEEEFCALASC
ncbi:cation transporter [Pontibacter qinzhouensis]|uniref:Cation transporter n=1 Tax=Pontibacter qinzhouensis TaxID=2603253 RepID=A0A5C8K9Q0_9BACT|nr:cation diffusion facilitator family transporter [Pontibacter qinzhouensis]TXK49244.1 cation transporter [Pontibacter qinzhouensis]